MKVGNLFYFGQLLLIGLILLFNCVIFVIVNYKLTCGRRTSHYTDKDRKKETLKRLQNAIIISVLLGLTWVSAFFIIIEGTNFAFQIIFCVLNSLQGLFIFLLFCVRQKEVRRAWRAWCCCRKDDGRRKSSAPLSSSAGTGTGTGGTRSTGGGYYAGNSSTGGDYYSGNSSTGGGYYFGNSSGANVNNGFHSDGANIPMNERYGQPKEPNRYDNSAYGNNAY